MLNEPSPGPNEETKFSEESAKASVADRSACRGMSAFTKMMPERAVHLLCSDIRTVSATRLPANTCQKLPHRVAICFLKPQRF
jgi:hypothetical protein